MAYMDEMALEREKSKQAVIAGKTPLFGADTTAAMHQLGVNLGVIPPGTPPSETTQVLANLLKGGGLGKIKVDEATPLQVPTLAGRMTASLAPHGQADDGTGATLGNIFKGATDSALQQILRNQQRQQGPTAPGGPGPVQGPYRAGSGANRARLGTPMAPSPEGATYQADLAYLQSRGGHHSVLQDGKIVDAPLTQAGGYKQIDPELAARLRAAGEAYEKQTGQKAQFGEFSRGNDVQQIYYDKYKAGTGGIAAPAGASQHQKGSAGDLPDSGFRKWLYAGNQDQYGLHFPVKGDAPHVQANPAYKGQPFSQPAAAPAAAPTAAPAAGPGGAVSLHAGEYPTAAALQDKSVPVGDRFNNPFNMWHDGYASVHGGKPGIQVTQYDTPAVYANKEAGAAAAIQKMAQSPMYSGKTMQDMIGQWVGHGQSYAPIIEGQTGISRNTKITPEFLASPDGLKFLKAMARYETDSSKPYGLTDAQWEKARRVALSNPPALANSIPPKAQPAAAPTAAPQATPQAAAAPAPAAEAPKPVEPTAPQASPQTAAQAAATPWVPKEAQSGDAPATPATPSATPPAAPAPAPVAATPTAAPAAAAPVPPPVAAPPVAEAVKPAPPAPPPKPAAPPVNPAHALLDTSVYELAKKSSASDAANVKMFLGDKITLREAMKHPMYGGMATVKAKENLGKAGITPQQFDQAVKEGQPKPTTLGKRSDLGTSDATDFSSRGRTPAAPDQVPTPAPRPANAPSEPMNQAIQDLKLTPQEQALYQRHLDNLHGPGGVDNPDGSRSTLYQTNVEIDGKHYNLPTVYDGKIVSPDEAVARAKTEGLDKFPSYDSPQQAEDRYGQMHQYMDRDTGAYFDKRRGVTQPETPQPPQPPQPEITPGIAKALENVFKAEEQAPAAPLSAGAMPVLPGQPVAPTPGPGSGGLSLAPAGLSSIPTGALPAGAPGSQGGSIAMAGMLPPIQNSTYSTPLLDQTAATAGSGMGLSPIPLQTLGSWGWGGGSIGAGLDWGGGAPEVPIGVVGGFD